MFQLHFLAGLLAFAGAFLVYHGSTYFFRVIYGTKVEGIVTKLTCQRSGGGPNRNHNQNYIYHVDYTYSQMQRSAKIHTGNGVFPSYGVGRRVKLLLIEARPEKPEFYTKQEIALRIGLLVIGALLIALATAIWLGMYGLIDVERIK